MLQAQTETLESDGSREKDPASSGLSQWPARPTQDAAFELPLGGSDPDCTDCRLLSRTRPVDGHAPEGQQPAMVRRCR